MDPKQSIFYAWKVISLATLLGFFLFFLFLEIAHENTSFLAAKKAIVDGTSFKAVTLSTNNFIKPLKPFNFNVIDFQKSANNARKKCNIFDGKWVYKPEGRRSYDSFKCPFVEEKMSCQDNGRSENEYEKWQWEARECDIPLFNGRDMLERLRNKRMILVGDSLNRNMWESLACLLYTSITSKTTDDDVKKAHKSTKKAHKSIWEAKEYNFTLEYYWSPFLIEINSTQESGKRVLVLDKISTNSKKWIGADIMIFNSGHWWDQRGRFKAWDLFEYKGKLMKDMPIEIAYEHGLQTWAKWIERNVDVNKTTLYFRSISAPHKFPQFDQWCYNKTQLITDDSYVPVFPKSMSYIVGRVLKGVGKSQVNYLNITKLSEHRIDAHPSMYRYKDWHTLTKKYQNNLSNYADCIHWCLPGVPDTWNRLLYASLFFDIFANATCS